MIKLSVIVPFYNVEPYIEQCICSLYSQDIPQEEYEVICVDDCSPDGSRAIVERLQKRFSSLKLICHKNNKKQGGARNTGLKAAQGKYLMFVDSDDYLAPNCMSALLSAAEEKRLDVLVFDYCTTSESGSELVTLDNIGNGIYTGEDFACEVDRARWYYYVPSVWNKLYCRDFLTKNDLFFIEGLMYEDTDWSFLMLSKARNVAYLKHTAYCYRLNMNSITHAKRTGEILFYSIMLLKRSAQVYNIVQNDKYKELIRSYITSQISVLRVELKNCSLLERCRYYGKIRHNSIRLLKNFCNWRTWFAVRYAITVFV